MISHGGTRNYRPFRLAVDVAFAKMVLDGPRGLMLSLRKAAGPKQSGESVSEEKAKAEPVVIKKYANRRLYNTQTSSYVTLDHLAGMVKDGVEFEVQDARTGEDITRSVLTQIIFEEEAKGQNLLPIKFLRQLIRFYGDSLQAFVPGYLDMSMDSFTKNQGACATASPRRWAAAIR